MRNSSDFALSFDDDVAEMRAVGDNVDCLLRGDSICDDVVVLLGTCCCFRADSADPPAATLKIIDIRFSIRETTTRACVCTFLNIARAESALDLPELFSAPPDDTAVGCERGDSAFIAISTTTPSSSSFVVVVVVVDDDAADRTLDILSFVVVVVVAVVDDDDVVIIVVVEDCVDDDDDTEFKEGAVVVVVVAVKFVAE